MQLGRPRLLVDALLFVATVFCTLSVGRVLSLIIPSEFYFTFQSLFSDRTPQNLILAIFGKMTAPFASGFALGWFIYGHALSAVSPASAFSGFARRLKIQWSPTMFLSGFFAAFLSAWPIIVYWDLLSNPEVGHLEPIFLILYSLYMLGYGYITLFGFLGAIFIKEHLEINQDSTKLVSMAELSRVGILWLLNSGLAATAMEVITK
ncbi:MAG: hypothetical protein JNK95_14975 [Candidatus Competibacter sp.]|nr:hypothetical protein [Candidatus Competibacter sp.]MDG4607458.1 hypothetical protein [Candidatus Contendobacter sp.]HRD50570.1 hypothetical protein [Candidatus Contendobacter sp.]